MWCCATRRIIIPDLTLLNYDMIYNYYINITIDENQEDLDISDHNQINIKSKTPSISILHQKRHKNTQFYKTDRGLLRVYTEILDKTLTEHPVTHLNNLNNYIKDCADEILLKNIQAKRNTRNK